MNRRENIVVIAVAGVLLSGQVLLAQTPPQPPPPRPAVGALPALARLRRERLLTRGETVRLAAGMLDPRRSGRDVSALLRGSRGTS